jgi:hypothetical protein
MSLFERLRAKWKHSDPLVRLEGIKDLRDQDTLESLVLNDPDDRVRAAAFAAITSQATVVHFAVSAESAAVRELAIARIEDRVLLQRIASSDPSPTVRARARAKCADSHSAGTYLRHILSKLEVAERSAAQVAEFCGTLDEVCNVLSQDPRFLVNGDVASESEDLGAAQVRDATQVAWATAAMPSSRAVARFVAQPRLPSGATAPGTTRFFHIKVWRTAANRFDLLAEEKKLLATHDSVAWSKASSGGPGTQPAEAHGAQAV